MQNNNKINEQRTEVNLNNMGNNAVYSLNDFPTEQNNNSLYKNETDNPYQSDS